MKFVLGLTGQTGAGKSSLHNVAEKHGFFVINCDEVAHCVTEKPEVLSALCRAFSNDILNSNGTLNRSSLAAAAFESEEKTALLNRTVLPFITAEISDLIEKSEKSRVLLDAPTLFESGADSFCNTTVGVIANREVRKKRIIERDGLTAAKAEQRINAGKSDEFFKDKCDYVITNNGEKNEFINNFDNLLKNILGGNCNAR